MCPGLLVDLGSGNFTKMARFSGLNTYENMVIVSIAHRESTREFHRFYLFTMSKSVAMSWSQLEDCWIGAML